MNIFSLQWHITNKCHNNCNHCYMQNRTIELCKEDFYTCLGKIKEFEDKYNFYITTISITGGDPLLNSEWFFYSKVLKKSGKQIAILGNPELLGDDNLSRIKELDVLYYQLSIDGMQKSHDRNRYNGSFAKTISAIKRLHDFGIPIAIMYTVSDDNSSDLVGVMNFLCELQIPLTFAFDFVIPIGNAAKNEIGFSGDKKQFLDTYNDYRKNCERRNNKIQWMEKPSVIVANKFVESQITPLANMHFSMCDGCSAGWNHLTILSNSDVLACRRMPIVVGNLLNNSFDEIFSSKLLSDLRNYQSFTLCSTCEYVYYCRGCPAENYARFKSPFRMEQCQWYKKNENHFKLNSKLSDWQELLSNTAVNLSQSIIDNASNELIKSLIILQSLKGYQSFLNNPSEWQSHYHVSLNNEELSYLFDFCIKSI